MHCEERKKVQKEGKLRRLTHNKDHNTVILMAGGHYEINVAGCSGDFGNDVEV
jgi:hypothetical protein